MLDQGISAAVEAAFHFGFPLDAGAVLFIEVDGLEARSTTRREQIVAICQSPGAREVRRATDRERTAAAVEVPQAGVRRDRPLEPQLLHAGRRRAAHEAAAHPGASSPTAAPAHGIRIVNVFHAGDGNIHPILLFDERDADQVDRVLAASDEILERVHRLGGSVTGEHGIGVEKINFMPKLFTPDDLAVMRAVHDAFNPDRPLQPPQDAPHRRRLRHGTDRTQQPRPAGGTVIAATTAASPGSPWASRRFRFLG